LKARFPKDRGTRVFNRLFVNMAAASYGVLEVLNRLFEPGEGDDWGKVVGHVLPRAGCRRAIPKFSVLSSEVQGSFWAC
jgi:hypothetical protein